MDFGGFFSHFFIFVLQVFLSLRRRQ
jgi:hypothetical protein